MYKFISFITIIGMLTILSILCLVGCKKDNTDTTNQNTKIEDPAIKAYKEGIGKYIEESQSLARGMEIVINVPAYERRIETLHTVFSRIPDPPPGNALFTKYSSAAKLIYSNFIMAGVYLKNAEARLQFSESEADKMVQKYKEIGEKQKANLKELESSITEGREPIVKELK